MLMTRDRSFLLMVDLQERLLPAIHGHDSVQRTALALMETAFLLDVPVLATEHCADKIGPLIPEIRDRLPAEAILPKRSFAATNDAAARERLAAAPPQAVVCGVEGHVCAMQAALGLLELGKSVFVVAEGIGSRDPQNAQRALGRLHQAGAVIVSLEMVLFEWTSSADDPAFKEILARVKGR